MVSLFDQWWFAVWAAHQFLIHSTDLDLPTSCFLFITVLHIQSDVAGATFMAAGSSAPELATAVIAVFIAKVGNCSSSLKSQLLIYYINSCKMDLTSFRSGLRNSTFALRSQTQACAVEKVTCMQEFWFLCS